MTLKKWELQIYKYSDLFSLHNLLTYNYNNKNTMRILLLVNNGGMANGKEWQGQQSVFFDGMKGLSAS